MRWMVTVTVAAVVVAAGCSNGTGVATGRSPSGSPAHFCVALRDALISGDNSKHDSPVAFYRGIAAAWDRADHQAPATVEHDVHNVARTYDQLATVIDQHGQPATDPPKDLIAAVNHLTGYLRQTCRMKP